VRQGGRYRPEGLSPLARGNHHGWVLVLQPHGPIPARAGEPSPEQQRVPLAGAYPRSRGGTEGAAWMDTQPEGLSPLARGNRVESCHVVVGVGPIPARAGEPRTTSATRPHFGAYPRSRGGTYGAINAAAFDKGLSPLARGNPPWQRSLFPVTGPIPARAGEPSTASGGSCLCTAYPRSRGGTVPVKRLTRSNGGLSPLARGNHEESTERGRYGGPIPARAGEPRLSHTGQRHHRAYPRSRGGTAIRYSVPVKKWGLSPLARGNRAGPSKAGDREGPIPARAGEPHMQQQANLADGAYPRSRGGTRCCHL